MSSVKFSVIIFASFLLTACATEGVNRADINSIVEVIYGKVFRLEPITFDSKADEAALIGGIDGAIENSDEGFDEIVSGALTGILVSGLFVSIDEGSNKGLIVDLKTAEKINYSLILKTTKIHIDDCLRVIKGNEISFKVVADKYCS